MVIGLFATPTDAALCLDNLAEADFDAHHISLVMKTRQDVEKIANVSGPLTGLPPDALVTRLVALGLAPAEAAAYKRGILDGGAFIAVDAGEAEAAAAEMLQDANARQIRVLKG